MPKSINMVILLGNLTRDPELKYTQSGTAVANCALATNKSWKDNSGELKESVEFHNLVFWGNVAELVAQYCHKGSRIHVTGELQTRSWETEQGIKKYKTEIVGRDVIFLDSKSEYNPAQPPKNEPVKIDINYQDVADNFEDFMEGVEENLGSKEAQDIADEIPFS